MLAIDFPRLWRDPNTPDRERKRLARLLLEDVTLIKKDQILVHIRFPGGTTRTLELPIPLNPKLTPPSVVTEIDQLLDHHTCQAIADNLNSRGFAPGQGKPFHSSMIAHIAKDHGLKKRRERLRERGMLTLDEMGKRLGIATDRVKAWRAAGLLRAHPCNDKDEYPYEDPGPNPPRVGRGAKLSRKGQINEDASHPARYEGLAYILPWIYGLPVYLACWIAVTGSFGFGAYAERVATSYGLPHWPHLAALGLGIPFTASLGMTGSLSTGLGEEIGWRGFLLPRLTHQFGFTIGCLLSGLIWALWHYPALLWADYNSGTDKRYAMACFTLMVTGNAFLMGWLRLKSGSLWPCAILHASHNLIIQSILDQLTNQSGMALMSPPNLEPVLC